MTTITTKHPHIPGADQPHMSTQSTGGLNLEPHLDAGIQPEQAVDRFRTIRDRSETSAADAYGQWQAGDHLREAVEALQGEVGKGQHRLASHPRDDGQLRAQVASSQRELDRAKKRYAAAMQKTEVASRVAGVRRENLSAATQLLAGAARTGVTLELAEVTLPDRADDEPWSAVAEAHRAKVYDLQAQREATKAAWDEPATAKARIAAEVDRLAALAKDRLRVSGLDGARPQIQFPMQVTGVAAGPLSQGNVNDDGLARAIDAGALAALLHGGRLLELLGVNIDEQYAAYSGIVLDPAARQRKIRELDKAIRSAERVEVEALWLALANGESELEFRPDTPAIVMLGVRQPVLAPPEALARAVPNLDGYL